MDYQEIEGDLIKLAERGSFDVIAHGCNCFCKMKRGVAPQMAAAFGCDKFLMEYPPSAGEITKLGQIDYEYLHYEDGKRWTKYPDEGGKWITYSLYVVNCYTQYNWGTELKPFDYEAFILCMRKMNHIFKGKHIGLPQIGSGLAGGNWTIIKEIIIRELRDCKVTVVIYKK